MRFYITIFLLVKLTLSLSQNYIPLLDNNNQWTIKTCNFGCITDTYYTNGDTIVNGINYKVLDGYHYLSRTFLLREEVDTKKIFLRKVDSNLSFEKILYDFSLQEGDTFTMNNPITPFPQNGGEFILDSIRMKPLLNNVDYKHFYFSPHPSNTISSNNVVWIEGIGSKSLINASGGNVDINGVGELICFYKNQNLVYSQLQANESCTILNLNSEKNSYDIKQIEIYILSEKNCFSFSNSEKINNLILYDLQGKKMHYDFRNFEANKYINLNFYPKGIYVIKVFDTEARSKIFKIITN